MDQNRPLEAKSDQNGPFWSFWSGEGQKPVQNKAISTKMIVLTILGLFGPVHLNSDSTAAIP